MRRFACLALAGMVGVSVHAVAGTVSITDAPITGPSGVAGADYAKYVVSSSNLTRDDAAPLSAVLVGGPPTGGNPAAPGGNVELFANSETAGFSGVTLGGTFQTATRTSFSGTLQNVPITVSSLNGDDWFRTAGNTYDTSYAGSGTNNTLAQKWFNAFFSFYQFDNALLAAGVAQSTIDSERVGIFNTLLASDGIQRLSDPNVSYVNQDDASNVIDVGLAGTQSYLKSQVLLYLQNSSLTTQQKTIVLAGLQNQQIDASELARLDYNGSTSYLYGFVPQSVALTTDDATESYNQNFNIAVQGVPEPTSLAGIALIGAALLRRRRSAR